MRLLFLHVIFMAVMYLHSISARAEHEHHQDSEGTAASSPSSASGHDHSALHDQVTVLPSNEASPTFDFLITRDLEHGWNLHILTTNFQFAPENVGGPFVAGEGHAHLYVDGEQVARIYGPWFHVDGLPHGLVDITVTLNGNDHSQLAVGELLLSVTKQIQCH